MEASILTLLKGDPAKQKTRKQNSIKIRHDVASNKKDYPLKGIKSEIKKKSKPQSLTKQLSNLLND